MSATNGKPAPSSNGHAGGGKADLGAGARTPAPLHDRYRELRAENRVRAEEIRGHRLAEVERRESRRRNLAESLSVDWVAPYVEALNLLRSNGDPIVGGPTSVWQRRYGKNWPIFQTEQELALFRAPARTLLATNGYAQGLVEGLTSYVLGTGCTYRVAKKSDRDDLPAEVVDAAQFVVDEILELNQWFGGEQPGLEAELFGRSIEDGEWILCHYPQADGSCEMRVQEPEQLTQPPASDVREYGFGILTPRNDPQKHLRYWLQYGDSPADGEEHDACDVTHMRCNVRRGMKRGFTDFAFDTYDGLYLAGRLRTNLADTAAQQAAIVYVRQHDNSTEEDVNAFLSADADYTEPDPLTGNQQQVKQARRGGREDVPKGMNYVPGPIATATPIHVQVLDACLRGAGCRWNAPPWLMSGDLNAMNYATSLTAESPFVKTVQRRQGNYTRAFRRPIWFALAHRIRTRGLPVVREDGSVRVWSWEEVGHRLDLVVTAPSPETRNKLEEAQRAATEIPLGVQSRQKYMEEQGRKADQIEADNQEYADKFGSPGAPLPTDVPPDGGGAGARTPALPRPESLLESFTGTDANGHHWVNGKQVAKGDGAGGPPARGPATADPSKPPPGGKVAYSDPKSGTYLHQKADGELETPIPDEAARKAIVAALAPGIERAWKDQVSVLLDEHNYLPVAVVIDRVRDECPPGTTTLQIQAALVQLAKDRRIQLSVLNEVQTLDTPEKRAGGAIWQGDRALGFVQSARRGDTSLDLSGYSGAAPPPRRESLRESFTGVDAHGHHWVNGEQVSAEEAKAVAGRRPVAKKSPAVPVEVLAKKPGADKEALRAIAKAAPSDAARETILDAEWNVPGADSQRSFDAPEDRRRYTVERLGAAWRDAVLRGDGDGGRYAAEALAHFGAELYGPPPGGRTEFDGRYYDSDDSVLSGPVRVVHPAVVMRYPDGGVYVATKGKAESLGRRESESADGALSRALLEHGFSGTIKDSAGRERHYVDGKQVAARPDAGTGKDGAGARTSDAAPAKLPADEAAALGAGIEKNLPPAVAKNPGLVAKIKAAAVRVAETVWFKVVQLTPAACNLLSNVDAYLDTPTDMKGKFAYNPGTAGGQSHSGLGSNDFVKMNLEATFGVGVSGHLAATIASQVLSRAVGYAKKKLTGAKSESEGDPMGEVAGLIADTFAAAAAALGLEGAPDASAIAKVLGALLKGK